MHIRTDSGIYEFIKLIGRGGWSRVYSAVHHTADGKRSELAVKKTDIFLSPRLSEEGMLLKKVYGEEYPMGQYEVFHDSSHAYLAMPLFKGITLSAFLAASPPETPSERQALGVALLNNLQRIHEKGITHNDMKPNNILIDPITREIRIIDFGCAKDLATKEHLVYTDIDSAVFAFELPPEYLAPGGVVANPALDIYAVTSLLAEILGVDKRLLVETRMNIALEGLGIDIAHAVKEAFSANNTLEEALFDEPLQSLHSDPTFLAFIERYAQGTYDFSSFSSILSPDTLALLNAMQAKNPKDRPSLNECIARLMPQPIASVSRSLPSAFFGQTIAAVLDKAVSSTLESVGMKAAL